MRRFAVVFVLLTISACVPRNPWEPRVCREQRIDPSAARYFEVSADEAFRKLRWALVTKGYRLSSQELRTGYLRGTFEKNHCRDPGPWQPAPSEGGPICDLEWPVFQWGEVEVFVDSLGPQRSRVLMSLDNWYRFVGGEEVSDVCPEDYDSIFDSMLSGVF
jgi:hypothetical protein